MDGGDPTESRLDAITDTTATGASEMFAIRGQGTRIATLLALREAFDPFAEENEGNTLPSRRSLKKWYPGIVDRAPASTDMDGTDV